MSHLFWTTFHGYSVRFSPFPPDAAGAQRAAVATAQYYGVAGNGRIHAVTLQPSAGGGWRSLRSFKTQDGAFDVAWNELNENQLVAGCGDGSVRLFDLKSPDAHPIRVYAEHTAEVSAVSWSSVDKRLFASASWDTSVRIYDPCAPSPSSTSPSSSSSTTTTMTGGGRGAPSSSSFSTSSSLLAYKGAHAGTVYGVEWHPRWPRVMVTVSGDSTVALWDISAPTPTARFRASQAELLCVDWAKYEEHEIATGGTDSCIRVWDVRNPRYPIKTIAAHVLPVRKLRYSPHEAHTLASASYDMSVAFWNTNAVDMAFMNGAGGAGAIAGPMIPGTTRCKHHREFVCGIDFSLFEPGLVATTAWDQSVVAWNYKKHPTSPPLVSLPPPSMRLTPMGGVGGVGIGAMQSGNGGTGNTNVVGSGL